MMQHYPLLLRKGSAGLDKMTSSAVKFSPSLSLCPPPLVSRPEPYKRAAEYGSEQREGRSKLSLRKFFSAIGLNSVGKLVKARSSSMEHLSLPAKQSATPLSPHHGQLKKAPSLQALNVVRPFTLSFPPPPSRSSYIYT